MSMQLQMDAGNTRLKWRLLDNATVVQSGHFDNQSDWEEGVEQLLGSIGELSSAAVSIVSGKERLGQLEKLVSENTGLKLHVAATRKTQAGVTTIYKKVEKLGVDRWLAMLAAHRQKPDRIKVIVDCGTAITVDVVNEQGQHLGGYIVPGLRLMTESLAVNTADLQQAVNSEKAIALGELTEECISHGVLAMPCALVKQVVDSYTDPVLFLTGGDAPSLAKPLNLKGEVLLVPDLVMDGLSLAFE